MLPPYLITKLPLHFLFPSFIITALHFLISISDYFIQVF